MFILIKQWESYNETIINTVVVYHQVIYCWFSMFYLIINKIKCILHLVTYSASYIWQLTLYLTSGNLHYMIYLATENFKTISRSF